MALRKRRREQQLEACIAASDLPKSRGQPFYTALNRLLAANGFDPLVEKLCAPYYAETFVRPGCFAGGHFSMLFVGSFEGLQSHRAISWRCTDSRSLGAFLGLAPSDRVPNHSCVSKTHQWLPKVVFDEVFNVLLAVAANKRLLWGEAIGIDSTTIKANASMRSIVRKDSGKGPKDYTKKLAKKASLEDPTYDALRQFDGIALENGLERRLGESKRSRRDDHADERWHDADGLQGPSMPSIWRPTSSSP